MRSFLLVAVFAVAHTACGGVTGTSNADSATPSDATAANDSPMPDDAGRDSRVPTDSATGDAAKTGDGASEAGDGGGPSPEAGVGAPCAVNSDCPVLCASGQCSALCLDEPPFTGGYCSRSIGECPAPSPDAGSGPCPPGTFCANGQPAVDGTGGDYCLAGCKTDGDCRTGQGYKCCPNLTHAGRSVCAPASLCP